MQRSEVRIIIVRVPSSSFNERPVPENRDRAIFRRRWLTLEGSSPMPRSPVFNTGSQPQSGDWSNWTDDAGGASATVLRIRTGLVPNHGRPTTWELRADAGDIGCLTWANGGSALPPLPSCGPDVVRG